MASEDNVRKPLGIYGRPSQVRYNTSYNKGNPIVVNHVLDGTCGDPARYFLRCADDTLCATFSDRDPSSCLAEHNAGDGKPYTKGRRPVSLAAAICAAQAPGV